MIVLLQRVSSASCHVSGKTIASIDNGLLAFIGFDKSDDTSACARGVERILSYRIFEDEQGLMNLSVIDCHGALLLVPQFTLAADTGKGNRPGFSSTAKPDDAMALFDHVVNLAKRAPIQIAHGQFGANMDVNLVNRGPATFILRF